MTGVQADWGAELKRGFIRAGGDKRSQIRVPSPQKIVFTGTTEQVAIHVSAAAAVANMQTDASAFEGWSLALVVFCGVKKIVLTWDPPADSLEDLTRQLGDARKAKLALDTRARHYQRFLYRAHHFSKLFRQWFELGTSTDEARALAKGKTFAMNAPIDPRINGSGNHTGEAALERNLQLSTAFRDRFQLEGEIRRQFPVGVFDGKVTQESRIFSGGKSAIDLLGMSKGKLVVFEIKDEKNARVGILSELLFYACVMRDAIPNAGPALFNLGAHLDISGIDRIKAVMLAPRFHPLVSNPRIIRLLNSASHDGQVPIEFDAAKIVAPSGNDSDYRFLLLGPEKPSA